MTLSKNSKVIVLVGFTMGCIIVAFLSPPIAQDPTYHNFADRRMVLGISNFYNVISNFPFLILGVFGLLLFVRENELNFSSISILTLFIGVIGIGIGSAYYHLHPSDITLVWDRIPMTITFMSFLSIIIRRHVNDNLGSILLLPLLIIGIASVIIWYRGEMVGEGDLRLYALVQFYPMIAVPLIIFMYPTPAAMRAKIVYIIVVYGIAKVFEHHDNEIFNIGGIISGHSIKHLFAAGSIFLILQMVRKTVT